MFAKAKKLYHNLLLSHATTEDVAQGVAIGLFVAMSPPTGFHTATAIFLAALLRKNKIAAALAAWVNNPLTIVPLYLFIYRIGAWITHDRRTRIKPETLTDFFHMTAGIMRPLLIGGLLVGAASALAGYYLTKWLYPKLKKKQQQIHEAQILHLRKKN